MHQIAFIVNTFQRPIELLNECVKSILKQLPEDSILVVVDQNPVPLSISFDGAKTVHLPEKSISAARNFGVKSVEAEWYVFIDDDGLIGNGSVKSFEAFLKQFSDADIIGGRIEIQKTKAFYSIRQNLKQSELKFPFLKAVMGGLLAIRRSCFLSLNGFDERFGIGSTWSSGEESDFTIRSYLMGKKIYYLPGFYLTHPAPIEMSESKVKDYALGKGALLKKHTLHHWHWFLFLEYADVFLVPIAETIVSLFKLNFPRARRAILKLIYRLKGFNSFN